MECSTKIPTQSPLEKSSAKCHNPRWYPYQVVIYWKFSHLKSSHHLPYIWYKQIINWCWRNRIIWQWCTKLKKRKAPVNSNSIHFGLLAHAQGLKQYYVIYRVHINLSWKIRWWQLMELAENGIIKGGILENRILIVST